MGPGGSSSAVEHLLAKERVEGSNPFFPLQHRFYRFSSQEISHYNIQPGTGASAYRIGAGRRTIDREEFALS